MVDQEDGLVYIHVVQETRKTSSRSRKISPMGVGRLTGWVYLAQSPCVSRGQC